MQRGYSKNACFPARAGPQQTLSGPSAIVTGHEKMNAWQKQCQRPAGSRVHHAGRAPQLARGGWANFRVTYEVP
jgi:hypothetical protein